MRTKQAPPRTSPSDFVMWAIREHVRKMRFQYVDYPEAQLAAVQQLQVEYLTLLPGEADIVFKTVQDTAREYQREYDEYLDPEDFTDTHAQIRQILNQMGENDSMKAPERAVK